MLFLFKIFYTFANKYNNIMKKRTKKKNKPNTNKIAGDNNSLRNNTGRPWPMTPKAGVTLQPRRYQFGGNYGR